MIIFPGMEIICKTIGDVKMNKIERIRKNRDVTLKKLDKAMDKWGPERIKMADAVDKSKNIFLDSYRNHKNQKISDKEFLQITNDFAQTLFLEDKLTRKIRKILEPLDSEFLKSCNKLYGWRLDHE